MRHGVRPGRVVLTALAVLTLASPAVSQNPKPIPEVVLPTAEILVLGTYHFVDPSWDLYAMPDPDLDTEQRRQELDTLVEGLAGFVPGRIAVEFPIDGQDVLDGAYAAFRETGTCDPDSLFRSEIGRVAFPLADRLGHDRVYAIDHAAPPDLETLFARIEEYDQQVLLAVARGNMDLMHAARVRLRDELGLLAVLRFINRQESLDSWQSAYTLMAEVGRGDDYTGADVVADWYHRNLIIFANLTRLIENDGERLLVLYDVDNAKVLRDLVSASPHTKFADPLDFVPEQVTTR